MFKRIFLIYLKKKNVYKNKIVFCRLLGVFNNYVFILSLFRVFFKIRIFDI